MPLNNKPFLMHSYCKTFSMHYYSKTIPIAKCIPIVKNIYQWNIVVIFKKSATMLYLLLYTSISPRTYLYRKANIGVCPEYPAFSLKKSLW